MLNVHTLLHRQRPHCQCISIHKDGLLCKERQVRGIQDLLQLYFKKLPSFWKVFCREKCFYVAHKCNHDLCVFSLCGVWLEL